MPALSTAMSRANELKKNMQPVVEAVCQSCIGWFRTPDACVAKHTLAEYHQPLPEQVKEHFDGTRIPRNLVTPACILFIPWAFLKAYEPRG